MPVSRRICRKVELGISLTLLALLAGNLLVFGRIAAGISQISDRLAHVAIDPAIVPAATTATASGNVVNVGPLTAPGGSAPLPAGPRTVEQVADYLGVTPDTVRDSYIPEWIYAGHMTDADRLRNRWLIPDTFAPYRPE